MSYRVCIPVAGTGSRLGDLTTYINKALLSVANRPTICHIIDRFPVDVEFVIALGYKGELVREFLELAYPSRTFHYSEVSPYEGPGSGLGLSLKSCKKYLQQPFTFISCDTLVDGKIPEPNHNWVGYANASNPAQYRTIEFLGNQIIAVDEKNSCISENAKPYIGLAGVYDHEKFWSAMDSGQDQSDLEGEAYGLKQILRCSVAPYEFDWFDTGNLSTLEVARKHYEEPNSPNILEKQNEAIWFVDRAVIKFSDDKDFIANRVRRVEELKGFVPDICAVTPHMYSYVKVEGQVLSSLVNIPIFEQLLDVGKSFWKPATMTSDETLEFRSTCWDFYKNKTYERVNLFYKNFSHKDFNEKINGQKVLKLEVLLEAVNWDWLSNGLAGRYHGDFHFENIIWNPEEKKFTFLDWRQDFGGNVINGDIYYDFAKLLHGLIVNHEIIANNLFSVDWKNNYIQFDLHRKHVLVECEKYFFNWLELNCYDVKKVKVMTALIFLNIAPLHHYPYSEMLYSLGKLMLSNELDTN